MRVVITGANGSIGRRLIRKLRLESDVDVLALVRSERAAETVRAGEAGVSVKVVDYHNAAEISAAVQSCDVVVHLVGIIKESKANPFELAHEAACQALIDADLKASHIVVLGVVGSALESANACLRSRARAEQILQQSDTPVTCIRVPMVLGEGDYASFALRKNGNKTVVFAFRASSLEQPIDSQDVLAALFSAVNLPPENRILDLAGPECLSRSDLIKKAGSFFGNSPMVISLPVALGYLIAFILEKLSANPPVTRAMLGVLDHDDQIDTKAACDVLDLELTNMDLTLQRVLTTPPA